MQKDLQDRRSRTRISTMSLCELGFEEGVIEFARVRDMTESGIKIASARPICLGDRIRVRLSGSTDWVVARVAWRSEGVAGLSFARPVRLPQVSGAKAEVEGQSLGATRRKAG